MKYNNSTDKDDFSFDVTNLSDGSIQKIISILNNIDSVVGINKYGYAIFEILKDKGIITDDEFKVYLLKNECNLFKKCKDELHILIKNHFNNNDMRIISIKFREIIEDYINFNTKRLEDELINLTKKS